MTRGGEGRRLAAHYAVRPTCHTCHVWHTGPLMPHMPHTGRLGVVFDRIPKLNPNSTGHGFQNIMDRRSGEVQGAFYGIPQPQTQMQSKQP